MAYDKKKPTIALKNIKSEQWLTNSKTLQVKIADDGSGIKSYRAEIDGKWILMEYSVKTGTLTYNFSDKKFVTAKHELTVEVVDNVGNKKSLSTIFYRKK